MTRQSGLPDTSAARAEILERVRTALSTRGTHHPRTDSPDSRPAGASAAAAAAPTLIELFVERVEDYRATVVRCPATGVAAALAEVLRESLGEAFSVVVPEGFGTELPGHVLRERDVADVHDVEGVDAVVTTAAVAVAETGTIVLDHGPGQGRRGLSLLPDLHVCLVRADQVVRTVPEAVAALRPSVEAGRPLTWVSGPSATSDIELDRVEGVHGPRTLCVVLVE
jgi:L-lactate dehydrogenase complex protein LldG